MLTPPALAVRLFRRLGRIKRFEYPAVMAEDGLEELLFLADAPSRHSGRQIFNDVRSVQDHFAFSSRFFGAHQLQAEICGLLDWAAEMAPRTVCEIGTAMGGTTYLLGQALPSVTRLLGVDLFVRRKQRLRFFARPDQRLTFFDGSSYEPATVARVARDLGGEKLDLLFIDGDHSLQGVAKDFAAYRGFVRDGGIIVFHDVVQDYTTRYGRRTPSYTGGVPQFWRQISPLYKTREFIESPEQDGFGIGALIYDSAVVPPTVV